MTAAKFAFVLCASLDQGATGSSASVAVGADGTVSLLTLSQSAQRGLRQDAPAPAPAPEALRVASAQAAGPGAGADNGAPNVAPVPSPTAEPEAEAHKRKELAIVAACLVPALAGVLVGLQRFGQGPLGLLWTLVVGLQGLVASAALLAGQTGWLARPEQAFWAINLAIVAAGVLCGGLSIAFDRKVDVAVGMQTAMFVRTAVAGAVCAVLGSCAAGFPAPAPQALIALGTSFLANGVTYVVHQFTAVLEPRAQGLVLLATVLAPLLPMCGLQSVTHGTQAWGLSERSLIVGPAAVLSAASSLALAFVWPSRTGRPSAEFATAFDRLAVPESEGDSPRGMAWPPSPYPIASALGFCNGVMTWLVVPLFILAKDTELVTRLISERFCGEMLGTGLGLLLAFRVPEDEGAPANSIVAALALLTATRAALLVQLIPLPQTGVVSAFMALGAIQQAFGSAAIAKAAEPGDRRLVAQSDYFVRLAGALAGLVGSASLLHVF